MSPVSKVYSVFSNSTLPLISEAAKGSNHGLYCLRVTYTTLSDYMRRSHLIARQNCYTLSIEGLIGRHTLSVIVLISNRVTCVFHSKEEVKKDRVGEVQ